MIAATTLVQSNEEGMKEEGRYTKDVVGKDINLKEQQSICNTTNVILMRLDCKVHLCHTMAIHLNFGGKSQNKLKLYCDYKQFVFFSSSSLVVKVQCCNRIHFMSGIFSDSNEIDSSKQSVMNLDLIRSSC